MANRLEHDGLAAFGLFPLFDEAEPYERHRESDS